MAVVRRALLDLRPWDAVVGADILEHGSARWSSSIFTHLVAPLAMAIIKGSSRLPLAVDLPDIVVALRQCGPRHVESLSPAAIEMDSL